MLPQPLDASPEEVRTLLQPLRNRLSIALCTLGNAFSVGAIIRVAHSYLVREIILIGDTPHYEKASMGMEKYETIVRVPDEASFLAYAKGRPLLCFEREAATRSLYDEAPFPDDSIMVFGSERFGTPASLLERATAIVAVPMYGVNHSLPVAVCAGIALSEWARRHYAGKPQLNP
ncbi:MAG: TrmH family RNA methyltransferase [Polyangiaceae bacterium]